MCDEGEADDQGVSTGCGYRECFGDFVCQYEGKILNL